MAKPMNLHGGTLFYIGTAEDAEQWESDQGLEKYSVLSVETVEYAMKRLKSRIDIVLPPETKKRMPVSWETLIHTVSAHNASVAEQRRQDGK